MSVQRTDRVLTCYRIGDPDGEFPIYDAEGARLYPGRWNTHTSPIIYTSQHYSTAVLEKLVHANLVMPADQHYIIITIPNGVSYEVFQTAAHPGWDSRNESYCKRFGMDWYEEQRSALLIVPSIPARPERNFLINPAHPDAKAITHTMPDPVWWDKRLYRGAGFEAAPRSTDEPSAAYRLIEKAMAERKQVICVYDGFPRELCPTILGHTRGQERVFGYQFAGGASEGLPPGGAWKCLQLHKMRKVKLRSGPWHTGTSHKSSQKCIEDVDLDVNPHSPYHPRRQLPIRSGTPKARSKTSPRSPRPQRK